MKYLVVVLALVAAACSSDPIERPSEKARVTKRPATIQKSTPVAPRPVTPTNPNAVTFVKLKELIHQARWSEALGYCDALAATPNITPAQEWEILSARVRSLEGLGAFFDAAKWSDAGLKDSRFTAEHDWLRLKANALIESRFNEEDLNKAEDQFSQDSLKATIYFRLAEFSVEQRNFSAAVKYFSKTVNLVPNTEMASRARERVEQIESARRVEPKTIGVVLPLTGKLSSAAQKTLRGVEMGLGLYGSQASNFKLAVVDSEANAEKARRGVETLIREDNVIAIIGGLISKTAAVESLKSSELGVPIISLSQRASLTESSPLIFRNSLTGEMMVRELVRYAMDVQKIRRFGILYPNDAYGVEYANTFWDEVLARGGEITAVQNYSPRETDFRLPIQRLVGTYYVEDRVEEYKDKYKQMLDTASKKSRSEADKDLLPPVIEFEALFIPDNLKSLGQISAMLSYNDVRGVKLLGTNLWNNESITKRLANSSNPVLFSDSWLAADAKFKSSTFVKDYSAQFAEDPGLFEIYGYDSALVLKQLISQGSTSRESLANNLSRINNIPGALSPLSINDLREIQRPVQILTVDAGQITPVNR